MNVREKNILVVDDEPALRLGICSVLNETGYSVAEARNGAEALEILERQAIDLIITDIAMPTMNGYQLLEHVCRNPAWASIPFLFLSARDMDSDIRYGKELGADDYLTKPIDDNDLIASVRGKLRRLNYLRQTEEVGVAPQTSPHTQLVAFGRLQIEYGQHRVWMDGEIVDLTVREFTLLELMTQYVNEIITPETMVLTTHELETDYVEASGLIRPLIRTLRRKLGYPVGELGCIENVRGVGYRFVPPL